MAGLIFSVALSAVLSAHATCSRFGFSVCQFSNAKQFLHKEICRQSLHACLRNAALFHAQWARNLVSGLLFFAPTVDAVETECVEAWHNSRIRKRLTANGTCRDAIRFLYRFRHISTNVSPTYKQKITRKLCYRKDDHAMRALGL